MFKTLVITILALSSLATHAESFTEAVLKETAESQNKELPMQVDRFTWLANVAVLPERKVLFNYQVNTQELLRAIAEDMNVTTDNLWGQAKKKHGNPEMLYAEVIDNIFKSSIIKANCTTPDIKAMLKDGVTLLHAYYRRDGEYITEIRVNLGDCG